MNCMQQPVGTEIPVVDLPLTINLHVTRACNFRCVCCYAAFTDAPGHLMGCREWERLIDELAALPAHPSGRQRKITFSGGEPTLLPYLPALISRCRMRGFKTALITNGSRLAFMPEILHDLDWLGVSIDSANPATLRDLGRCCPNARVVTPDVLAPIIARARVGGCRIKINTVVSRLNLHGALGPVVAELKADRWKLLQMLCVVGQNDGAGDRYGVSRTEFEAFVAANSPAATAAGVTVVPESVDAIAGSYCMIAPTGCFFDDITGQHRYSRPILSVGAQSAFTTTNRGTKIDDAIVSRLTARFEYGLPSAAEQKQLWRILGAQNGVELQDNHIDDIVRLLPDLSGRDIKNLLKLALVGSESKGAVTPELLVHVSRFRQNHRGVPGTQDSADARKGSVNRRAQCEVLSVAS